MGFSYVFFLEFLSLIHHLMDVGLTGRMGPNLICLSICIIKLLLYFFLSDLTWATCFSLNYMMTVGFGPWTHVRNFDWTCGCEHRLKIGGRISVLFLFVVFTLFEALCATPSRWESQCDLTLGVIENINEVVKQLFIFHWPFSCWTAANPRMWAEQSSFQCIYSNFVL